MFVEHIYNTIKRAGNSQYSAKLIKLPILHLHKMKRLSFAQKIMIRENQWLQVVFADKKNIWCVTHTTFSYFIVEEYFIIRITFIFNLYFL